MNGQFEGIGTLGGVEHAIREIIANALDENALTNIKEIEISFSDSVWHIGGYGRGLQYKHFTQNEDKVE